MDDNSFIDVINDIIFNSSNQGQVKPAWVANAAYKDIDPEGNAPLRVRYAATQHLKHIARQQLRGKFEPTDNQDALQHHLFPTIQARYPTRRKESDGDPIYIKPELMSADDWSWNIHRLRTEATTKLRHADALEQWGVERGLERVAA